ncbi:MAG: PQQ-binding-like beta-propeller repeat protein [Planctomycetota bacterium]
MNRRAKRLQLLSRRGTPGWNALLLRALVVLAATVAGAPRVSAALQDDEFALMEMINDESSVFVRAPREILRPLIRAKQAIEQEDYSRAVELLGELLSDEEYEDFLVRMPDEDGASISLRSRATTMLGSIPVRHRELYELRYGVRAQQLLQDAIVKGDFEAMSQIMDRFFYTPAGFNAAMLSGHYHLQQGRPVAAAFCFERIVTTPEARTSYDPEASVLLATCWILNGSTTEAREVLFNLKQRQRTGNIVFQGREVPLFDAEDPVEWLRTLIGDSPLATNAIVQDWVMFRGNPQRNANSSNGMPLMSPRWTLPTLNDPDIEREVHKEREKLVLQSSSTIPGVQPLAIGDTVIMRTADRMIGVDFPSGKRMWTYPPFDDETFFKTEDTDRSAASLNSEAVNQRMWQDAVYGQVSSDGRSIFVVPHPGFAGSLRIRTVLRGGTVIDDPMGERAVNELTAVDLAREGEFRWQVGGETGLDEPRLAGAFFLGPPLPLDRSLFAICQQDSEIRLVCLDPESGRLSWSQQLASAEASGPVSGNVYRRLAGATPSFSDGLIVCPTGVGAVVAVDISTRSLIWGYQYLPASARDSGRINPTGNSLSGTSPHDSSWQDSTITISGGTVLVTPVDKQQLIALDLLTGQPKWESDADLINQARDDSLYVGNVTPDRIVLVGTTRVRALSLQNAEEIWSTELGDRGAPAGHGYGDDHFYYLPTTGKRLLKLDIGTGQIVQDVQTATILGNLICHQGYVISHGVDHLSVFPQDEPSRQLISNVEARGALPARLKSLKAQLLLQENRIREAAELVAAAYVENPGPANEALLLNVIVLLLETDFDYGMELAARFDSQLATSTQSEFVASRIDGLIRKAQYKPAFDLLAVLLDPRQTDPVRMGDMIEAGPVSFSQGESQVIRTRMRSWLQSRLQLVLSRLTEFADPETLTEVDSRLHDLLNDESSSPVSRFTQMRTAGLDNVRPEDKRTLLSELLTSDLLLPASILSRNLAGDQYDIESAATGERAIARLEDVKSAVYAAINPVEVPDWRRGEAISQVVPNSGDVRQGYEFRYTRNQLRLLSTTDPRAEQFMFRYFSTTGELEIVDRFGHIYARSTIRNPRHTYSSVNASYEGDVRLNDGVLAVRLGAELFLLDWHKLLSREPSVLWSVDLRKDNPEMSTPSVLTTNIWGRRNRETQSVPYCFAGEHRICYIDDTRLICIDSISGEELWQQDRVRYDCILLGGTGMVIVWDPRTRVVRQINITDGSELKSYSVDPEFGTMWIKRGTTMLMSSVEYVGGPGNTTEQTDVDTGTGSGGDEEPAEEPELEQNKIMQLLDLDTGKVVWSRTYNSETTAALFRDEKLVVLSSGTVDVISIESGGVESSFPMELPGLPGSGVTAQVKFIDLHSFEHDYILKIHATESASTRYTTVNNTELRYLNYYRPFWNGYTIAIDRNTGAPRWTAPARTQYFQYASNTPWSSPVLFLLRRVNRRGVPSTERYWTQVMGIDMTNGRLAQNQLTPLSHSADYRIEIDPLTQAIEFFLPTKRIILTLTTTPGPPGPVAHITGENSVLFDRRPVFTPNFDPVQAEAERQQLLERIRAQEGDMHLRREEMRRFMEQQTDRD